MAEVVKILERGIRLIEENIKELEAIPKDKIIETRIAPTARGAMFTLRKAFYAVLGRLRKEKGVDRDLSIKEWKKTASYLIDYINKKGLTDIPMKIILQYEIDESQGKRIMRLSKAWLIYFEVEGIDKVDLTKIKEVKPVKVEEFEEKVEG